MYTTVTLCRSPNRKFREATDKVGDKLRAYAQKFKETRGSGQDRGRCECPRSASAGRSADTIEEETTEDVEAERCGGGGVGGTGPGVTRAYSLNSKPGTKPVLQSHSSTESTDTVRRYLPTIYNIYTIYII